MNMYSDRYAEDSLELHLFFGRIMKEHALFLKAGFTGANPEFSAEAECYKREFEKLLCQAVRLSDGVVSRQVLDSGELVTEYTLAAEKRTEKFTCIAVDQGITRREMQLAGREESREACCREVCGREESGEACCREDGQRPDVCGMDGQRQDGCGRRVSSELCCRIHCLNQRALELLDGLIGFKERILKRVLCCEMFTGNYPLLIEHIIREAKLYRQYVEMLERDGCLTQQSMTETECFWNRIMMEHALFIRGLLDPTEGALIQSANDFAKDYGQLLEACCDAQDQILSPQPRREPMAGETMAGETMAGETMPCGDVLGETIRFRDFKKAGAEGILQCKIRSLILPLLADHVLREANHYIRLLR